MYSTQLQSYFKKVSDIFRDTCNQKVRLEEEIKQMSEDQRTQEITELKQVLQLVENNGQPKDARYFNSKYSKEDLEKRVEALEDELKVRLSQEEQLKEEVDFWNGRFLVQKEEIIQVLNMIYSSGNKVNVTTQNEVYALLHYFKSNGLISVINVDKKAADCYPTESGMCEEFYYTYVVGSEEAMRSVIEKYI